MRILFVASEVFPLVKTGGLADVVGALPPALRAHGLDARVLVPGYPAVLGAGIAWRDLGRVDGLPGPGGWLDGRILAGRLEGGTDGGLDLMVLDQPALYGRAGNPYTGPDGRDWPDNAFRFAALSRAAARIGLAGAGDGWRPDVVHAHDWQAGLAPAYLVFEPDGRPRPATVTTIHNIAFQGVFDAGLLGALALPPRSFTMEGLEYYGGIGFLKAGLFYADRITTVSPTYADEITTPDGGMGLDGLLRKRRGDLVGLLNGIDTRIWNPAADPALPAPYDAGRIEAKAASKAALQHRMGLAVRADAPLFGVVSRLTWQKGLDLVLQALPGLLGAGGQLAVLGSGDRELEDRFRAYADAHKGAVGLVLGYDEPLSHLIQAGSDALLVPSRFEPCGLTQMYALRYGTVPVVRRVGGLADTVRDGDETDIRQGRATGFTFERATVDELEWAVGRAVGLYGRPDLWRGLQRNGMACDNSWEHAAKDYAALYRSLRP